jgi:hypothetical protein
MFVVLSSSTEILFLLDSIYPLYSFAIYVATANPCGNNIISVTFIAHANSHRFLFGVANMYVGSKSRCGMRLYISRRY